VAVQADWLEKNLYDVLGVAEDSDGKTISRAYRKLARDLHPDTHPDDPEAAERFKEVTAAYDVIGDETKRAEYDEFRRATAGARRWEGESGWSNRDDAGTWTRFGSGGADGPEWDNSTWTTFDAESLDDLFSSVMGRAGRRPAAVRRGDDLEAVLDLGFEDAIHGLTTEVTLSGPDGSRTFKVRVPAGIDNGQRIRLAGRGGPGSNGGAPGDLYAVVRVGPHPVFGRRGQDLTAEAAITWPEAVLGSEIEVPTLDGSRVRVRVPAGTPPGRTLRVRGYGVRTAKGAGDLLVSVRVTVPTDITGDQRQAVEAVAAAFQAA
jgi:molecular chaperone DnaJ